MDMSHGRVTDTPLVEGSQAPRGGLLPALQLPHLLPPALELGAVLIKTNSRTH